MTLPTEFAPAERLSREEVQKQSESVTDIDLVHSLLDSVPCMSLLLNSCRQIVFANQVFRDFVGEETCEKLAGARYGEVVGCLQKPYLGARPGEAVGCIHANNSEGGCGTTEFCKTCGAIHSILNAQHGQVLDVQECRLLTGAESDALDLRVWSKPVELNGENYTLFSVMDIRDEKRKQALERIFFHDVMNTAGGVKGLADLMIDEDSIVELKGYAEMVVAGADRLIDEIVAQRSLTSAESGELSVNVESISSSNFLARIKQQFHSMDCAAGKKLYIERGLSNFTFKSDPTLLYRVLINMTKNALEAVELEQIVTISAVEKEGRAYFSVHNPTVIPEVVQLQIFERSFSTKGTGRGLGTYSIKLITERYLQGVVSFSSTQDAGTIFTANIPI